eukprot:5337259-Prymnesium_polylepis.1
MQMSQWEMTHFNMRARRATIQEKMSDPAYGRMQLEVVQARAAVAKAQAALDRITSTDAPRTLLHALLEAY